MELTEKLTIIEDLLRRVIGGELKAYDALDSWPEIDKEKNKFLKECWYHLTYYAHDEDIREKDQEYAKYQIEQLLNDIKGIKKMVREKKEQKPIR